MSKIFLYHNDSREGKLFNIDDAQERYEELVDDGWVDTPANLELLEEPEAGVTAEEVEAMSPEQIIKKVIAMGFHVLNDVELAAIKSGLNVSEDALINRYIQSPKSLTKEELVVLGADYDLKLKMTMNEDTMVSRINEAIESSKGK